MDDGRVVIEGSPKLADLDEPSTKSAEGTSKRFPSLSRTEPASIGVALCNGAYPLPLSGSRYYGANALSHHPLPVLSPRAMIFFPPVADMEPSPSIGV